MPVTDVYIAPISAAAMGAVYPPARQVQLDNTTSEKARRQRYAVWKLLEYALLHSRNLKIEQLDLSVDAQGKWHCKECFFSLSHSQDAVAVAVSDAPVGVDMEALDRRVSPDLWKKILTEEEQAAYTALSQKDQKAYLLQMWCAKESLFKAGENVGFSPGNMSAQGAKTGTVTVSGKLYAYAVATSQPETLKIHLL